MSNLRLLVTSVFASATVLAASPAWADCGGSHGSDGYTDSRHRRGAYADGDHKMAEQRRHDREAGRRADRETDGGETKYGGRDQRHGKGWRKRHGESQRGWRRHGHMRYGQRPWAVLETSGERDPAIFVGVWPSRPTHGAWWRTDDGSAEVLEMRWQDSEGPGATYER
jgi:hypothetical protein